jgi:hypothetical protein
MAQVAGVGGATSGSGTAWRVTIAVLARSAGWVWMASSTLRRASGGAGLTRKPSKPTALAPAPSPRRAEEVSSRSRTAVERGIRPDLARELDPVHLRHVEVDDDDVEGLALPRPPA